MPLDATRVSPTLLSREIMSLATGMQERVMSERPREEKKNGRAETANQGGTGKNEVTRRRFLSDVAAGSAAAAFVPRHVLGRGFPPPSDLLNIAGVGVGGMGRQNLINLSSQNIVALCDIDWGYADKGFERFATEIPNLQTRIDQGPPPAAPGKPAPEFDRAKAKVRLERMVRFKNEHLPKAKRYQDYRE